MSLPGAPKEQKRSQAASNPNRPRTYRKKTYTRSAYRKSSYAKKSYGYSKAAPKGNYSLRSLKIPECTVDYVKTVLNPFDMPAGACLPCDLFPLPSQKLKVFGRGICTLGTGGYGFINAGLVLGNDVVAVNATSATSSMSSSTVLSAVTNTVPGYFVKLPWSTTDIAANLVQGRGVALGIRVRYTGREDGRNGILNFFEDQDHVGGTGLTYDVIRQYTNTYACRPNGNGDWDSIVYSGPVTPSDLEFRNENYLGAASGLLYVVISGVAGDQFEFEVFQHIEAIGRQTSGKSMSHADPNTYSKAQETLKMEAAQTAVQTQNEPSIVKKFVKAVVDTLPFVVEQGSNVMKALDGDPMAILNGAASSAGYIIKNIQGRQYSAMKSAPYRPRLAN
jgi:hypothetical protein